MKSPRRTYVDVTERRRPEFMAAIRKRLGAAEGAEWPLTTAALELLGIDEDLEQEMGRIVEQMWRQQERALTNYGISRSEFLTHARQEREYSVLKATLEFEAAALGNHALFGSKTYHFSPNLVERLALTELNVAADLVVPPFRSCVLFLDDDTSREALSRLGSSAKDKTLRTPITVFVSYMPTEGGAMTLAMLIFQGDDEQSHVLVKRQLLLKPGARVEDALHTDWNDVQQPPGDGEVRYDETLFYTEGLLFFRIVVNAILYLGSSNADISAELSAADLLGKPGANASPKERKHFLYEANRATQNPFIIVGGVVRPMSRPSGDPTKRVQSRTLVSGHWKSQAHGPGRELRRIIHVEPYYRGPEMADLVDRPYLVR